MLIRHFPNFLQSNRENILISQSLDAEFEILEIYKDKILNNAFVNDADVYGVTRFENVVNIVPTATQTLDDRKTAILTKMNEQLPYTINKLRARLLEQCGYGNFSVELEHLAYILRVKITIKQDYNAVCDIIESMIPCNLINNIIVMYESHRRLQPLKHSELSQYTHRQIREMKATDGDYKL